MGKKRHEAVPKPVPVADLEAAKKKADAAAAKATAAAKMAQTAVDAVKAHGSPEQVADALSLQAKLKVAAADALHKDKELGETIKEAEQSKETPVPDVELFEQLWEAKSTKKPKPLLPDVEFDQLWEGAEAEQVEEQAVPD